METNNPILAKHFKLNKEPLALYYSVVLDGIEITIEPCLSGYDVGLYDNETKSLIYPKIECHFGEMALSKAYAISAANRLYRKYLAEDPKDNG